jgi:hypothetical protein
MIFANADGSNDIKKIDRRSFAADPFVDVCRLHIDLQSRKLERPSPVGTNGRLALHRLSGDTLSDSDN